MEWMLMPLKKYADFSGRSRRKEYWMFMLLYVGICLIIGLLGGGIGAVMGGSDGMPTLFLGLIGIAMLALIIPSIAVQIRRFHDIGKSGWYCLLGFIPYIGGLIVLYFMCKPGESGPNRFGADPKGGLGNENLAEVFS